MSRPKLTYLPPHVLVTAAGVNPRLLARIDQTPTWTVGCVRELTKHTLPPAMLRVPIAVTGRLSVAVGVPTYTTELRVYYPHHRSMMRVNCAVSPILLTAEDAADAGRLWFSPDELLTDWRYYDGTSLRPDRDPPPPPGGPAAA